MKNRKYIVKLLLPFVPDSFLYKINAIDNADEYYLLRNQQYRAGKV